MTPRRQWLPALPPAADAVTIRQLLTHTSGLVDYEDVIPASMTEQLHDADVLALLETEERTYFPPGTAYRYSNSGYALLALIVERASGRSFAEFLRERIFRPLGMAGTVAHQEGIIHGLPPGVRLQRRHSIVEAHGPEPDERGPRRRRHLLVDRRPGAVGCRALRRPAARCGIAPARVRAGDAHGRPFGRIRLRLADHGGLRLALRRDRGVPQRHRPLPGAPADDRHPHEPRLRRALPGGTRHCGARPACRTDRKHQENQHVTSAPEPPRMPRFRAVSAASLALTVQYRVSTIAGLFGPRPH